MSYDENRKRWVKRFYTKNHQPRKQIPCWFHVCDGTMKLILVNTTYVSGDLHKYECPKCGSYDTAIL